MSFIHSVECPYFIQPLRHVTTKLTLFHTIIYNCTTIHLKDLGCLFWWQYRTQYAYMYNCSILHSQSRTSLTGINCVFIVFLAGATFISCDFEMSNMPTCQLTIRNDWRRGRTAPKLYSPKGDHTTGSGMCIYLKSGIKKESTSSLGMLQAL